MRAAIISAPKHMRHSVTLEVTGKGSSNLFRANRFTRGEWVLQCNGNALIVHHKKGPKTRIPITGSGKLDALRGLINNRDLHITTEVSGEEAVKVHLQRRT
jgi:hypothetical protein